MTKPVARPEPFAAVSRPSPAAFCATGRPIRPALRGTGTLLTLGLAAFLSLTGAAQTQTDRNDPTVTPAAMADALRVQLAELRAVNIRALVVGADNDGIAILYTGKGRALTSAAAGAAHGDSSVVRAGTAIIMDADGLPVRLVIKRVTAEGVELEAPTLSEKVFIPGSFKAMPAPGKDTRGLLRYLECKDLPLETVLRLIADQTDTNLSPSSEAAQENVTVFLRNISAESAVEEICRTRNLWFRKDEASDIVRVTTMAEYEKNLSSFREETTESFTLLYPNVLEVAAVIYGLYPERVMLSLGEEDILENELDDLSQRFDRFNSFSAGSDSGLMRQQLGTISAVGGSGGGIFTSSGGRSVRVGANQPDERVRESFRGLTPSDAKALDNVMRQDDTNAVQRTLGAYREKNASIFITASRRNNLIVVRTGDAQVMSNIRDLIRRLDVPTPMVLLEVKVLQLSLNDDFTSSFEYEFNKTYNARSATPTEATAGFPGFNPLATTPRTDSMSFQILSDNLNVRIQMLEGEGRVKTLATPMLLTANNEVSRLFIGEERPMVRDISIQTVVTENSAPVITIDPLTALEAVGTMLLITPNINADRTVTLRLLQENSKIIKNDASIPVYSPSGGGVILNVPVDITSSRTVSGTFVAKDGMTVAAGGLIEESESEVESRIPVLGRVPYLGWFFRSTEKVKSRTELIMLIKPHVISTPSEGEAISRRVTESLSAHPAADGRPSLGTFKRASEKTSEVPPGK
jgi:general secretion pathway protein D